MLDNPLAKRAAIAAAIGAVVAIPLPICRPGHRRHNRRGDRLLHGEVRREFPKQPAVEIAFERNDDIGEMLSIDPFPMAELGMLGGDVDIIVGSKEAAQVPILQLAFPFAAPQFALELLR